MLFLSLYFLKEDVFGCLLVYNPGTKLVLYFKKEGIRENFP